MLRHCLDEAHIPAFSNAEACGVARDGGKGPLERLNVAGDGDEVVVMALKPHLDYDRAAEGVAIDGSAMEKIVDVRARRRVDPLPAEPSGVIGRHHVPDRCERPHPRASRVPSELALMGSQQVIGSSETRSIV